MVRTVAVDDIRTEGCAPERRRVVRVVQLINLAFLAVDLGMYGSTWPVLGGRLLISVTLLAIELLLASRASPRALRYVLTGLGALLAAGFGVLALGSGGPDSPYLGFLAFLAIVVGIAVPDEPAVNVAAGVSGGVIALAMFSGRPAAQVGFVAVGYGSCTFYGAASAALYRRMRRRERAAWIAQAESAAALARSELQRVAAERSAAVGRIAAELGHELSGPMASVAANLRYVEEELPRLGGDPELQSAVRDSRQAMERAGRVVSDLRVLTPDETSWGGGEVDLPRAIEYGLRLAALRLGGPTPVVPRLPPVLPPVRASARHLSQVVSILVGMVSEAEPSPDGPVAIDVAVEGRAVKVILSGRTAGQGAAGPERTGVGLALCRELAEPWGGRVEARPIAGGRMELALTLACA
jgi:signal transduction histidine kinase